MDLRTALDRVSPCVSPETIAAELGSPLPAVEGEAPEGWQGIVARLARDRARELLELADELDPPTMDPDWESAYG